MNTPTALRAFASSAKKEVRALLSPRRFLMLNLGMLLLACGVHFFKTPNGFCTGGVSGLSISLSKLVSVKLPQAADVLTMGNLNLFFNCVMLLIGLIFLGKSLALATVYCSLVYSLEVSLLEIVCPLSRMTATGTLTDQPLLELVFAILLTAGGSAILFHWGASSGGTDILALIVRQKSGTEIGHALIFTDALIALSTFYSFAPSFTPGLYSILGLLMKCFFMDNVIENFNLCKCFIVITDRPEEIEAFIVGELHHSATEVRAEGVYTHSGKMMLYTVCRRSEAIRLKHAVRERDPQAFVIITNSSEIIGRGFLSE